MAHSFLSFKPGLAATLSLLLLLLPMLVALPVQAATLADGTWSQGGSPGTTTITFTTSTGIAVGDKIVLTFPSQASINGSGTNITMTSQSSPTRANDTTDNSITITADAVVSGSTAVTITMTDGLSSYTTSTYAQQSLAINHNNSSDTLVDFGLALITNDNTSDVRASVPLSLTLAVNDVTIDLGTLSSSSVSSAAQTYTLNTNNTSGATLKITSDGALNNAGSDTINAVSDGTVTAGSEEYGITLSGLSGLTTVSPFDAGDDAVPTSATNFATVSTEVSSGTVTVTFEASIEGTTPAGSYDQVVTVTAVANT